MAGDGLTDTAAVEQWRIWREWAGDKFPTFVREICEVAFLGAALLVASRFVDSTLLRGLYWLLLFSFAARIGSRVAFPTSYHTPIWPVLGGTALTLAITYCEHVAIRSAADAAVIQMQGDRAAALLAALDRRDAEEKRLINEQVRLGCLEEESLDKKTDPKVCKALQAQRDTNARSADALKRP